MVAFRAFKPNLTIARSKRFWWFRRSKCTKSRIFPKKRWINHFGL